VKPVSYIAAAKRAAYMAGRIEQLASAATPRQRAALTRAIHCLSHLARNLSERNRRAAGH
jgi:hypothetical protein